MENYIQCGKESKYVITKLGCYNYCETGLCEPKKPSSSSKSSSKSSVKPSSKSSSKTRKRNRKRGTRKGKRERTTINTWGKRKTKTRNWKNWPSNRKC